MYRVARDHRLRDRQDWKILDKQATYLAQTHGRIHAYGKGQEGQ